MPDQILQILDSLRRAALESAPRVLLGILAAIALVLVAKGIEAFLRLLLTRLRFDQLLAQVGMDRSLQRLGLRQSLNVLLPRLAYYLLLLLFAQTAADAFGLSAISRAIAALFAYLPKVVAALLLVVVGTSVASVAGTAVHRWGEESGMEFARTLGSLVSGFVIFLVTVMAIGQLEFDTAMVRLVTACVLGGFALAFAISIGFGTRDITRNVLAGFYARKVFSPGDKLEVRGIRGELKAITSTQTLLEQDGVTVSFANTVFLDDTIRS